MKKASIILILCLCLLAYDVQASQNDDNFLSFLVKNTFSFTGYTVADDTATQDTLQDNSKKSDSCTLQKEECNDIDDDCDGIVDEIEESCGDNDIGACQLGTKTCKNGKWGSCKGVIYPEIEVCDGSDNDCNGKTDENLIESCGANKGVCISGTMACSNGKWSECSGNYVGPKEEECNGVDDNCDGKIDEKIECSCTNGQTMECASNVGACEAGIRSCINGKYDICENSIEPTEEICDGIDNDCDGQIDDGLMQECGESNTGSCKLGEKTCTNGEWSVCIGSIIPTNEVCNGLDDDCDGNIDESVAKACGTDMGSCSSGYNICENGIWSQCKDNIIQKDETCDAMDNDCDGETDEGGICGINDFGIDKKDDTNGNITDDKKKDDKCNDKKDETCNELDDNCDGQIDEGIDCYSNIICKCEDYDPDKGHGNDCDFYDEENPGNSEPRLKLEEKCQKGIEAACDRLAELTEECFGIECIDGSSKECGTDEGECSLGTMTCNNGKWSQCKGDSKPSKEICDEKDNDCDGKIDEDIDCDSNIICKCNTDDKDKGHGNDCDFYDEDNPGNSNPRAKLEERCYEKGIESACKRLSELLEQCFGECLDDSSKECGSDIGACSPGTQVCMQGKWTECKNEIQKNEEICDGIDNDCDGQIDEDLQRECGNDIGICAKGKETCTDGAWSECVGQITLDKEICNGMDDDCDGDTDENITQECGSDIGTCVKGKQICINGEFGKCDGIDQKNETCDGFDNNCDGLIDNGLVCICEEGQTKECGENTGVCKPGMQTCTDNIWGTCQGMIESGLEICDGIDNDCDGETDEDIIELCGETDIGACQYGKKTCENGTMSMCIGNVGPAEEICDGIDNDCDGFIDESIMEVCGDNDKGECSLGYRVCENGNWSMCIGEITPGDEVCDKLDNNCNGQIDENLMCIEYPPIIKKEDKKNILVQGIHQVSSKRKGPKEKIGLDLTIVKTPNMIDINDGKFQIEAIVENVGEKALHNVIVSPRLSEGYSAIPVNVGDLDIDQKKGLILDVTSQLCNIETIDKTYSRENITAILNAEASEGADDQEYRDIPLNIPLFSILLAQNNYSSSNLLHVCLLINNLDNPSKRYKFESEIEVFDNKDDLIIDFISPIKVDENQLFIKVKDYQLNYVPRAKDYNVQAKLLENGSVFTKGYIVAEDRDTVDLRDIKEEKATWNLVKEKFKNWFLKGKKKSGVLRALG